MKKTPLNKLATITGLALIALALPPQLAANSLFSTSGNLADSQIIPAPAQLNAQQQANWGGVPTSPEHSSASLKQDVRIFGAQLFHGGFSGMRADVLNPDYQIMPGDRIVLRLWGSVTLDTVLPVDSQGNVFIPTVGPVAVQGAQANQLENLIMRAVQQVYREAVSVYAQLQGIQPVGVFVTGQVNKPGRYAGTPDDSVLYFLDMAKGINQEQGSFRHVQILRQGRVIQTIDLYDFLLDGQLPSFQFQEGDTILVPRQGASVSVSETQSYSLKPDQALRYELLDHNASGAQLWRYLNPAEAISHVLLQGTRQGVPFSNYLSLDEFKKTDLRRDDVISFKADERAQHITVQIEGSYLGHSHFVLAQDMRLLDLLHHIAVDPNLTDTQSISIRRQSVAQRQKESLLASLDRLESTYLTANSSTPEEAAIRVQEARLITDFVQKAKQAEPDGRLVVATGEGIANVRLQDGDIITIPTQSEAVMTSGQVLVPTALVYRKGFSVQDYIDLSGGLTKQADPRNIVLIRLSGEVIADRHAVVYPGDEILVLPKVPTKNIQLATSITQILFQIAVATRVALDL